MFENIVGNDKQKNTLINSVKSSRSSHSYLFIGNSGIGKKLIAKEFAKMLLCLEGNSCGGCKACIEFDSNNNPDFMLLEAENGSIKIEQIRLLQRKVAEKPIISKSKVYIINDADLMTIEAQNCLLKTLEEPPQYVTIILVGTNENNFLSTIKSRCTIIPFSKIPNEDIKKYLEKNYNVTNISSNMLDIFDGSIGKAIQLKDKGETYKNIDKIIQNLDNYDIISILNLGEEIYKAKDEIFEILEYINVLLLKLSKKNSKYANCIYIIEETKKRIKANSNYNMCIDYMLFGIWEEVNEKYCWS